MPPAAGRKNKAMKKVKSPLRISVESNIGSRKTSIIGKLKCGWFIPIPENRSAWDPWIQKSYEDPTRWCFTAHTKILMDMCNIPEYTIVERSPWSVFEVFIRRYYEYGMMTQEEFCVIYQMYASFGWEPDIIIYIKVPVEQCFENLNERKHPNDKWVSMKDLISFDSYYERALSYACQPVIRVDGTKPIDEIATEIQKTLDQIIENRQSL